MWEDLTTFEISVAAYDSNADYLISVDNQTKTADRPYLIQTVVEGDGGVVTAPSYAFKDEEVTLIAETNPGYTWVGWFDGETKVSEGTSLTYTFDMPAESKTYTAKFTLCVDHTSDENCICTKCGAIAHTLNEDCVCSKYRSKQCKTES